MPDIQTYVLEDFPGFFEGPILSKLPFGSMLAGRGGSESKARTLNVQVATSGELRNSGFYSRIGTIRSTELESMTATYHWNRNVGGDWLLFWCNDSLWAYTMSDDYGVPGIKNISSGQVFQRIPIRDPHVFGMFEPFGDALYYADGYDVPVRIAFDTAGTLPIVAPMGLFMYQAIMLGAPSIDTPICSAGGGLTHSARYACTLVTKYGESAPLPWDPVGGFYTPPPLGGTAAVPSGIYPIISVDWYGDQFNEVTKINLYRTRFSGTDFYWCGEIRRGIEDFIDCRPDDLLGEPMPTDHDPPSNFRLLRSYNNRMWAVGGFQNPNRVSWSMLGNANIWPSYYELQASEYTSGDSITQTAVIRNHLYFFLRSRILRLTGYTPDDYGLEVVSSNVGCVSPRTLHQWGDGVVFLDRSGLYYFDGSNLSLISTSIYGMFERSAVGSLDISNVCGVVAGDYYYLSYQEANESASSVVPYPNRVLICNLRNGKWGVRNTGSFLHACSYNKTEAFAVNKPADGSDGTAYLISEWPLQDTSTNGPTLYIGHTDFGEPDKVKVIDKVEVWYESLAQTNLTVTVYKEYPPTEPTGSARSEEYAFTATSSQDAAWGDTWITPGGKTGYYATMRVFRSMHSFSQVTSKTFTFLLEFGAQAPELRIVKIVFKYNLEKADYIGRGVA